jgi:hypothetical protein
MSSESNLTSQRADFWALLVGIDDYQAVPKLRGCVNDIKAMHDFLIRHLLVPEEHILSLTTDEPEKLPTRDRIIRAFQDFLINNPQIKYGDQILFHFSGHGSQLKDTTGLEPDGYNETLVAQDSRNGQVWDIPDKTIAALLDQLVANKGANITVILDSCHSGSGTRKVPSDGAALIRQLPPDDRLPPPDLDSDILGATPRRQAGPSGWASQDIPYTLLAACRDKEEASEHLVIEPATSQSLWHGAMTYFSIEAMRQMPPGTSYTQIHERVAVKVITQYPTQMPQCEGRREREVFGNSHIQRDPFILVKHIKGQITLEAGLIHQIQPGTQLALYPDTVLTRDKLPSSLATIEIESVSPTTAQVRVLEAVGEIPELSRGLVTEVVYTGQVQTVALHAAITDERQEALPEAHVEANQAAIARLRQYLEANPSPYLSLQSDPNQPTKLRVEVAAGKFGIYNAKGELLVLPEDMRGGTDVAAIVHSLESISRYQAIMDLSNREAGSQLVGQIEVKLRHLVDGQANELPASAFSEGGELSLSFDPNHQDNNYYVVDITNHSTRDVYPYVFTLNPDYSIVILYPRQGEQNAIAPGRTFSIGLDQGQQPLEIYLPDGWDSSRDYLKTIITTAPADFTILEQEGLNVPPRRGAVARQIQSPLDQLIDAAVSGARTRFGRRAQTLAGEDWTTVEFSYTVVRRYHTVALSKADHSVSLGDGLTLEKPAGFTGNITVTTWDQTKRGVDGDADLAPPPSLYHHPDFEPIGRVGTRGVGTNSLVLALEVDENSRQLITRDTPLRLKLPPTPGEEVADILPIVFDGEDYLPIGYGVENAGAVEIITLPESKTPARRGLARTLRLFVYKKMGRYTQLTGLRYAKRTDGQYEYAPIQRDQFKPGNKGALLVHGFNSDTGWMLKTVAPFLYQEVLSYDHILTWDYETLGTTIERIGEDLATALKQLCGFKAEDEMTLHVYAHSMGSVVSRCMIELFGGHEFVDGSVIAGPPNRGTTLATSGRGAVYLLTLLLNEYSVVPPVGVLNWSLKQMYDQTVGPADLMVDSDLLRRLNSLEKPDNVRYLVLAGKNILDEAKRNRLSRLAHKILDTSLEALFGEDHDLVIGLSSLRGVRSETYPDLRIEELSCNHFAYYDLPQARQIIKEWINR